MTETDPSTDARLSLVEGSEYDHAEYGRVRLAVYREGKGDNDGEVLLERLTETTTTRFGTIPVGIREPAATFREHAVPADIAVSPPAVEMSDETNTPTH